MLKDIWWLGFVNTWNFPCVR